MFFTHFVKYIKHLTLSQLLPEVYIYPQLALLPKGFVYTILKEKSCFLVHLWCYSHGVSSNSCVKCSNLFTADIKFIFVFLICLECSF